MQWWNDFVTWLSSDDGWRVISGAILPFIAIVVAGLIASLIARASSKRLLEFQDRELKAAAVMALIGAGRKATVWSSLGGDEKQRVDGQLSESDIRIRLLPVNGTNAAADWAAHELATMKKNSANFSFQAEQTFVEYRDRLLEWQNKPKRARKLFAYDLEQWRYEDANADKTLVEKQQKWAANQVDGDATPATGATTTAMPVADVTPASAPVPAEETETVAVTKPATAPNPLTPSWTPPPAAAATETSEYTSPVPQTTSAFAMPAAEPERMPAPNFPVPLARQDTPAATTPVTDFSDEEYAPPVTAGTVRQRTDPEKTDDDN
ncbi:hypothetical protein [Glaciihabitans sp. dw_435]|uniref:hypothetical protein n=1 Tax=Glaciihabitans sp. dw_435 TaxID=2720081 RepID=UPI001BD2162E|nr:hypothetical protein [Glaciihabitans sp. dw_435]